MEGRILYNAIRTPDGTLLISRDRDDMSSHRDKVTGGLYSVSGGMSYRRRTGPEDYEELSIIWHPTMPHDILREYLFWGTKGKSGKASVRYVLLKDLSDDHIESILDTQELSRFMAKAFFAEIEHRNNEKK